ACRRGSGARRRPGHAPRRRVRARHRHRCAAVVGRRVRAPPLGVLPRRALAHGRDRGRARRVGGVSALTFGVVPGAGLDAECLARLEELPVDALWMGGHVASPNPSPEVMMALAVLAARTRRVRVGTSILLLPLYTPAIVAKQVADLDRVTGGRVTLGVGIGGEYPGEFRACRVPIE